MRIAGFPLVGFAFPVGVEPAVGLVLHDGDMVVVEGGLPNSVQVVDPVSGPETILCPCSKAYSITDVAASGGKIELAGDPALGGGMLAPGVLEVDPATGNQRVVSSGHRLGWLQRLAVEPDDRIVHPVAGRPVGGADRRPDR